MKPRKILEAATLPLTEPAVLLMIGLFWVLTSIGIAGGAIGLFVLLLSLPAIFRYLTEVVDATARNEKPGPLDAELLSWSNNFWALFPLPVTILFAALGYWSSGIAGTTGVIVVVALYCVYMPACFALLAITHSPMQCMNPVAIARLYRNAGITFLLAPAYLAVVAGLIAWSEALPAVAGNLVQLLLMFSFAAVTGALIAPRRLVDDVAIPEPLASSDSDLAAKQLQTREQALNHAYGFVSRGNRDGGFRHIATEVKRDPEPLAAWQWYLERIIGWEDRTHALFFAQRVIHELLLAGETVAAVKTCMRARLLSDHFVPLPEDLPELRAAAKKSGNIELAAVLRS